MMERRHNQSDSATVDIAKSVSAHLLIGRTNVGAGRATYAAQSLFKMRISPHLTAAIIDKNNVHLFVRRRGTSNKSRIPANFLGPRTARKQTQLCHSLCN